MGVEVAVVVGEGVRREWGWQGSGEQMGCNGDIVDSKFYRNPDRHGAG